MNDSNAVALLLLFGLAVIGGLIALAVFLIKKSGNEAKQAELAYQQTLQRLPQDKHMLFVMHYNTVKKNGTTAVLLALFLGGLGIHKFYLGQTGLGLLYLVFCWTYVPALIALIEAFMISGQVGKYNQQKTMEITTMLGALH